MAKKKKQELRNFDTRLAAECLRIAHASVSAAMPVEHNKPETIEPHVRAVSRIARLLLEEFLFGDFSPDEFLQIARDLESAKRIAESRREEIH
jgi:hypothetical protein